MAGRSAFSSSFLSTRLRKLSPQKGVPFFEGKTSLYYDLSKNGISTKRLPLDFSKVLNGKEKQYLEQILSASEDNANGDDAGINDTIRKIENGFQFRFPHLSYRVIGNFSEHTLNMKANIKAFTSEEVFVDSIDLYKNRECQNFIYSIMERFNLRDQIQIENDLNQIIEVIEKHKEKKGKEKKRVKGFLINI